MIYFKKAEFWHRTGSARHVFPPSPAPPAPGLSRSAPVSMTVAKRRRPLPVEEMSVDRLPLLGELFRPDCDDISAELKPSTWCETLTV